MLHCHSHVLTQKFKHLTFVHDAFSKVCRARNTWYI